MASLIGWLKFSGARTATGATVASGTATFYVPGSSSVKANVWSDSYGSVALANPVSLDAAGRAEVWASDPFDIVIKDSGGVTVAFVASEAYGGHSLTASQVEARSAYFTGQHGVDYAVNLPVSVATVIDRLGASFGIDGQYKESGTTGAVTRNFADVLRHRYVAARDYGAVGDGVVDDTTALQRAIDRAAVLKVPVYLEDGTFKVTAGLSITAETHIVGSGKGMSKVTTTSHAFDVFSVASLEGDVTGSRFPWSMRDFSIQSPTGYTTNACVSVAIDGSLTGRGGTIERVDMTGGQGLLSSGAQRIRVVDCNVTIAEPASSTSVGILLGAYSVADSCSVDGTAFTGSAGATIGIEMGDQCSASNCLVRRCETGIRCDSGTYRSVAKSCEMSLCGVSIAVLGEGCGAEHCTSSDVTTAAMTVSSGLSHVVDIGNSWTVPVTILATDDSTTTDGNWANLSGLSVDLIANVTYEIEWYLAFTCHATYGLKVGHTGGTATFGDSIRPRYAINSSGTPGVADAEYVTAGPTAIDFAGVSAGFVVMKMIATCATAGTFVPQIAQHSAGAEAAVIKARSWARVNVL